MNHWVALWESGMEVEAFREEKKKNFWKREEEEEEEKCTLIKEKKYYFESRHILGRMGGNLETT